MNIKPRQIPKFDIGGKPSTVNWSDPNSTWFTRSGNQILETTFNTLKSLRDKWKASGSLEDYKKFKQYVDDLNNNQRYGYAPGHLHYKQGNNQLFIGRGTDAWQNMVRNNYKYINDAIGNNYSKYHVVSNLPNSGDSAKSNWKVDNYWAGETDDRTTWGNLLNPNDPDYLKWKDKFKEIGIDYRTNPSWNNGDELYGFLIEDNPLLNKKIQPNNLTSSKLTDIRGREEFGNKQQNNSLNLLRKYLPNLLGTARLIGNLWNNNRVYKETLKGYNPNLKDSYKTHRIVVGDEAGKLLFYNRAAQGETKAGRAVTSNMDTQLAYLMENKRVGDELRRQGDIIDNQEIRRTSDEDMQHLFANAQRATEIANYNREAINAYKRDIHDLKAAKMSADWTSIDNELLARETRLRQRDLNNEQIREQLALLDYQNELNNDTEYLDANDELNDAIRDAKARNVDIKSDPKVKEAYNKLLTIQYQRKRKYLENSIYYAKKGTKITTKRKDDLLYKTAKDNGDHYRKMIKLTSDARKRKRITIDKLTSHPKGNTRKMLLGGVAPFTIYRPAVVGGEQSISTRSSSSDSSKKDVTSYEFVKDLFKEMKGRGNPSDMNSIYIKVKNFLDEQSLFGNEITPDDMATFFISINEELNQTDSLKAKSDKAKELAINNDALNEYAVTSNGELVVLDLSGKIKTSRASLQEIFEQGYTPLTNEQLSNFRVYHPEYAGRVDFDAIVANGVGMSKIASHIKSIIPAIKSNLMKEDNYVSNKLNLGIKALLEAPPGEYKQTITLKSNLEQAQYALNYIKGMLPKNMVKVLSINAQERGISPDLLIASLISSESEVELNIEYAAVTGKGAKDGTGSNGSDSSRATFNDMVLRGQIGIPREFSMITKDNQTKLYSLDSRYVSELPKVQSDMSISQMLSLSEIGLILDSRLGITFGDQVINPENLNDIMFSIGGGATFVTLPCKYENGHKVVNFAIKDEFDEAIKEASKTTPIDWTNNEFKRNLANILKEKGLNSLLTGSMDIDPNMLGLFLVVEGFTTDRVKFNKNSKYVEKVNNPDKELENRLNKALSVKGLDGKVQDYGVDINDWNLGFLFEGGWDDIYHANVFIPLNNDPLSAQIGNDSLKRSDASTLSHEKQDYLKLMNAKNTNSNLL